MKECFICHQVKPLDQFYAHPRMADKHLNKCKECTKTYVKFRYRRDIEKIKEYDRARNKTKSRIDCRRRQLQNFRASHPEKNRAHAMVAMALRSGKLIKMPCEVCGNPEVQAHHEDYSKPLEVKWLCLEHHREAEGRPVFKPNQQQIAA